MAPEDCGLVVPSDDGREYEWEYGLVSTTCSSLQFASASTRSRCRQFQLRTVCCRGSARTFNPKVAGSIPARPITIRCPAETRIPPWGQACQTCPSGADVPLMFPLLVGRLSKSGRADGEPPGSIPHGWDTVPPETDLERDGEKSRTASSAADAQGSLARPVPHPNVVKPASFAAISIVVGLLPFVMHERPAANSRRSSAGREEAPPGTR